jgi:hypothetical protein
MTVDKFAGADALMLGSCSLHIMCSSLKTRQMLQVLDEHHKAQIELDSMSTRKCHRWFCESNKRISIPSLQ